MCNSPARRTRVGLQSVCAPLAQRGRDAGRHHEAPSRCLTFFRQQLTETLNSKKLSVATRLMLSCGPFRQGPPSFLGSEISFVRAERIVWASLVLGLSVRRISLTVAFSKMIGLPTMGCVGPAPHTSKRGPLHRKLHAFKRFALDAVKLHSAVECAPPTTASRLLFRSEMGALGA